MQSLLLLLILEFDKRVMFYLVTFTPEKVVFVMQRRPALLFSILHAAFSCCGSDKLPSQCHRGSFAQRGFTLDIGLYIAAEVTFISPGTIPRVRARVCCGLVGGGGKLGQAAAGQGPRGPPFPSTSLGWPPRCTRWPALAGPTVLLGSPHVLSATSLLPSHMGSSTHPLLSLCKSACESSVVFLATCFTSIWAKPLGDVYRQTKRFFFFFQEGCAWLLSRCTTKL